MRSTPQWRVDYEEVKVKRDTLAVELREVCPAFVAKIVDLFLRVQANDAELSRLHQARPCGVALHLREAELEVRNLDHFTSGTPSIAKEMRLPRFEYDLEQPSMAWPPRHV